MLESRNRQFGLMLFDSRRGVGCSVESNVSAEAAFVFHREQPTELATADTVTVKIYVIVTVPWIAGENTRRNARFSLQPCH